LELAAKACSQTQPDSRQNTDANGFGLNFLQLRTELKNAVFCFFDVSCWLRLNQSFWRVEVTPI
jgi:hypothetical protein